MLKDEIEEDEHIGASKDVPSLRHLSMEEANAFLSVKLRTAKTIAYAAFWCILSPIALWILSAVSESRAGILKEDIANGIGMIALIILVAIAAVTFISSGSKTSPFAYTAYWVIAVAVYLGYSLSSNNWGNSWIIWVVAGGVFFAVIAITNAAKKKSE